MKVGLLNSFKINCKSNFDTTLNNNYNIYQNVKAFYGESVCKFV